MMGSAVASRDIGMHGVRGVCMIGSAAASRDIGRIRYLGPGCRDGRDVCSRVDCKVCKRILSKGVRRCCFPRHWEGDCRDNVGCAVEARRDGAKRRSFRKCIILFGKKKRCKSLDSGTLHPRVSLRPFRFFRVVKETINCLP
jgi:hypothetical protein